MTHRRRRDSWRRARVAGVVGVGGVLGLAGLLPGVGSTPARAESAPTSVTYTTNGEHAFVVPIGVTSVHVVAVGASGHPGNGFAAGDGGDGANVTADVAVTPGATFYAEVNILGASGGRGTDANFNPPPTAGSGGGESDLRTCASATCSPSALHDPRLLVAGGGGGGAPGIAAAARLTAGAVVAVAPDASTGGPAGVGTPTPCSVGSDGIAGIHSPSTAQGKGGACTQGGQRGTSSTGGAGSGGTAGTLGFGGAGGSNAAVGGGGGGGGFYGGGGGAADAGGESSVASGAGGGGSSCAPCAHVVTGSAITGGSTATLATWRVSAGANARLATTVSTITNASITAAGGAAARVTISYVTSVSATPTATAITTPPTGSAGGTPGTPWQLALMVGGALLVSAGIGLSRRTSRQTP